MRLILKTDRGGTQMIMKSIRKPNVQQGIQQVAFQTVRTVMLAVGLYALMLGGDALAFGPAIQGVGSEICNVYKAVKGYIAPAVALLMFGIAFVELKTGNRGAQARASAAFFGALFFANIGAIVQLTKLPLGTCAA
jgi:hypothetical protein